MEKILIFILVLTTIIFFGVMGLFRIWYLNKQDRYNSFLRKKALIKRRSKKWVNKRKEKRWAI